MFVIGLLYSNQKNCNKQFSIAICNIIIIILLFIVHTTDIIISDSTTITQTVIATPTPTPTQGVFSVYITVNPSPVYDNNNVTLQCYSIPNYNDSMYYWYDRNGLFLSSKMNYTFLARINDSNHYTCAVEYLQRNLRNYSTVELEIISIDLIHSVQQSQNNTNSNVLKCSYNGDFNITWHYSGNPDNAIGNQQIFPNNIYTIFYVSSILNSKISVLSINSTSVELSGTYTCRADFNELIFKSLDIQIFSFPTVRITNENYIVAEDSEFTLECYSEGFEIPTIDWFINAQPYYLFNVTISVESLSETGKFWITIVFILLHNSSSAIKK